MRFLHYQSHKIYIYGLNEDSKPGSKSNLAMPLLAFCCVRVDKRAG